jgi:hypothetical protein
MQNKRKELILESVTDLLEAGCIVERRVKDLVVKEQLTEAEIGRCRKLAIGRARRTVKKLQAYLATA